MQYESVPLFMCYLVLLMHNYFVSLVTPQPGGMRLAPSFKRLPAQASLGLRVMHWMATGAAWLYARLLVLMSYMHVLCNEAAFAPHCLLIQIDVCTQCPPPLPSKPPLFLLFVIPQCHSALAVN